MARGNDHSSPPSPSWTEGRPSLDSLDSVDGGRPSFDPDVTLPLPDDVQAQMDSASAGDGNGSGNGSAEGNRLLQLMTAGGSASSSGVMTEEDAGALLSHLTQLQKSTSNGNSNNNVSLKWNPTNVRVLRTAVRVAMISLNSTASSSNGNDNGSSNSVGVGVMMDGKMARRILTDGILPFASSSASSATGSSMDMESGSGVSATQPAVWIAKLMRSTVVEDLLPTALFDDTAATANANANKEGEDATATGDNGNHNTTALEILLSTFLTRMDADESSQVLGANNSNDDNGTTTTTAAAYTVDDILDRLSGVPSSMSPVAESPTRARTRLRPSATAAVLATLRELETNLPNGRLSRRRVWKTINKRSKNNNSNNSSQQNSRGGTTFGECHYEYTDRPTHLLKSALVSLKALAYDTVTHGGDPDMVPPLVYQLGLLPMGLASSTSVSGLVVNSNSSSRGSEKHRGMRLRRMCLEGIAAVLDEDGARDDEDDGKDATNTNSSGIVLHGATAKNNNNQSQEAAEVAWRWAKYTSLAHLGSTLRSDPEMSKAVLGMLAGDIISFNVTTDQSSTANNTGQASAPFRYARLTPFKLAMGLSMASSVPRMRTSALSTVRDLILEEETMRIKRGLDVDGRKRGGGEGGRVWMDCLVRCLEMTTSSSSGGVGRHHVLSCLLTVAKFAENEHHNGGMGSSGGGGGGCASSLLQSLTQLGFLLVDCVKKDEHTTSSTNSSAIAPLTVLAPNLDISSFTGNAGGNSPSPKAETSAAHATASIGRFVLCYIFYQSAASSSHFLSSSLSSMNNTGSSSDGGGTALCRSILRTSMDKYCGMAPNALEHALLLNDLLRFSPLGLKHLLKENCSNNNIGNVGVESLDDNQREQVIPLSLTSSHLPSLIDTLSNVPGGGLHPHVASQTILPALGHLLLLQATTRSGLGSLWKRTDLEDHVDHAFLLAKKSLFSADVEKRRCASRLLVILLGVAAVASSTASGRAGGGRVSSGWSSMLYDMKGCLRRCLTQHQSVVRMEAYGSLMALMPTTVKSSNAHASQDSASPASAVSGSSPASRTPPPRALRSHYQSATSPIKNTIPPAAQNALVCIASELLLSSLERYVTIPKEESTDRDARRERSAQGVGLSQMEMVAEEETPERASKASGAGAEEERSSPFRFEKCISTRQSSNYSTGCHKMKKGGKKSKVLPIGQSLLAEALERINEPLPFLIASCISVTPLFESGDESDNPNEMKKALHRIRHQMAGCTDVDSYTKWIKSAKHVFAIKDNAKRAEEMAINKIATLVLVASTADVLLNTCDWGNEAEDSLMVENDGNEAANDIEDLFGLRTEAIEEAAVIMSSFVSAKPKKVAAKKKLKEVNANSQQSQSQSSEHQEEPKKKNSGKSSKEEEGTRRVKSSEINDATRARNRKLIEGVIHNATISPAMNHEFLAGALRKFGAEVCKKACDDADSDEDEEENADAALRLAKCLAFRRFVITKILLLMSGQSCTVRPGARFGPLAGPSVAMDEKSASTMRIAASLTLGPLLFVEFCSHCYEMEQTSLASKFSSLSQSSELSLAQLSLRAFTGCVGGMTYNAPGHAMSSSSRTTALLMSAVNKASAAVPSSADGWNFYREMDSGDACVGVPEDDMRLGKTLLPFISLAIFSDDGSNAATRLCLFSELLSNGMHGEAVECCHLISLAAEAFSEPNMKEQLGVILLRGWELGEGAQSVGVLGLDHGEEQGSGGNITTCVSSAIRVAMKLNCGLDGNTHVPIPNRLLSGDLRTTRSKMGLPTTLIENWPERHQGRLKKESLDFSKKSGGIVGIGPQLAWALSISVGIGDHFLHTFDKNSPTKRQLKLEVIKAAAAHTSEKSSIANNFSFVIDEALNNADFVTLKMIPHISPDGSSSLDLAQRFVSCLLFSVSKMISVSSLSAEFMDVNGNFASGLLKKMKRLYGILAKLIMSFMDNPPSLTSKETKCFLDYLTSKVMARMSALLMTLQEKQETAGGKFLAESKIESHGKISALLVFEKEKLDNALLKVAAKLKQTGLGEDGEWLEDHVVTNLNRDFVIKRVEDAKAREAPKTKKKESSSGAKRKVKSEPTENKSKKKKTMKVKTEEEEEYDSSSEIEADANAGDSVVGSVDADESIDEDEEDAISLDRLTAMAMDEDSEHGDSDDDSNREESESEEEEFE